MIGPTAADPIAKVRETVSGINGAQADAADELTGGAMKNGKAIAFTDGELVGGFGDESGTVGERVIGMTPDHPGAKLLQGVAGGFVKRAGIGRKEWADADVSARVAQIFFGEGNRLHS